MGIFLLINLSKMIDLTISQTGHIVKLVSGVLNKAT